MIPLHEVGMAPDPKCDIPKQFLRGESHGFESASVSEQSLNQEPMKQRFPHAKRECFCNFRAPALGGRPDHAPLKGAFISFHVYAPHMDHHQQSLRVPSGLT